MADFLLMKIEIYDESGEISASVIAEGALMIPMFLRLTDDYLIYITVQLRRV